MRSDIRVVPESRRIVLGEKNCRERDDDDDVEVGAERPWWY